MRCVAAGLAVVTTLLIGGCGSEGRDVLVPFGSASLERRMEFCKTIVRVMKDYDDLYGSHIKIVAELAADGRPAVTVRSNISDPSKQIENAIAVAITNFALEYPKIGFAVVDENTWRLILPDDMVIEERGSFRLHIP